MSIALDLAKESFDFEEVPVGAVVVKGEKILGKGRNTVISDNDVSSHAEINAIRHASVTIGNYRLNDCVMYVTLEPCHMCAKAIVDARICSVIFGCSEPKTGSIISIDNFFDKKELNHNPQYQNGLFREESSKLLKDFFSMRR
tara:strand:- start:230 stop:658 length:429 start_codon:yes stop_codon:yes gene_type:complete